jgi:cytochrome P450
MSVGVIGHLLGVADADQADFRDWTNTMLVTHPPAPQAVGRAIGQLHAYIADLVADKRRNPGDDLLSDLAMDHGEGRLSEHELTSLAFLILVAGYENSINLIANTMLLLLRRDEDLVGLDQERVTAAVDESLRQTPPAPVAIRRFPVADLTIGGTRIAAGETVLLSLAASGRDPDAERTGGPMVAFGLGPHHCLGAALARAEAEEAIAAIAGHLPNIALAQPVEQIRWRPSFRTHGPAELRVTWRRR